MSLKVYSNRNQDTSYAIEERFFHSMELLKSKMGNFFTSGEEIFSFANSSIYIFVDDMDSERETTIDEYYADCFDESPGIAFNLLIKYLVLGNVRTNSSLF